MVEFSWSQPTTVGSLPLRPSSAVHRQRVGLEVDGSVQLTMSVVLPAGWLTVKSKSTGPGDPVTWTQPGFAIVSLTPNVWFETVSVTV